MPEQITHEDVVDRLLEHLPAFQPEVDEHLAFYDELLPHVLFGD